MALAHRLALLLVLVSLTGCATGASEKEVQRAAEGPTAEEVFASRFLVGYHRAPTFDESVAFRTALEHRVSGYLTTRPELNVSPRASHFTFYRRVSVGMSKEEIVLLVGAPDETTQDAAQMQAAARQFWPEVRRHAGEMWVYPGGWQFYFDADRLIDLTVAGKPPL